jgi:glycerol kinase
MADATILAIDQGTSATKCLLVDSAGRILSSSTTPVAVAYPRPGWVEQSAQAIWASVVEGVGACVAGHDAAGIVAVGLSTQRESLLLWDRATGRPLGPMLGWQDQRTVEQVRGLREAGAGERVREISGLPLDPMFSALKAKWLLDRYDPDRRRAAAGQLCLGTVDSWLIWKLTGRHRVEIGNAARTQLFDVRARAWSEELLAIFDVPARALPAVVASAGPLGAVEGLPLPSAVPLTAVLGDSHAALFGHGVFEPGAVKATFGTGSSLIRLAGPDEVPPGLCLTIAWETDRPAYAVEGNIRATGAVLTWLARLLGSTPEAVAEMASPDSAGIDLVPAFGGLAAPWWDEHAAATLTGLSLASGPQHLARAAIEAIALQVNDVLTAMGPVRCLLADGGGSGNDALMQLQADLGRVPVERARGQDLSALGAAHLAGHAAGVWDLDGLRGLPRERDTFLPCADEAAPAARVRRWQVALARARLRRSDPDRVDV